MNVEQLHELQVAEQEPITRGELIRSLRVANDLSQKDLSQMTSISQGYISQLESDKNHNPGINETIRLAQAFGGGVNFLDGKPSSRVFLKPEARRITTSHPSFSYFIVRYIPALQNPDLVYLTMQKTDKPFHERIREQRMRKFKTQDRFSSEVGFKQGYVSELESGKVSNPSYRALKEICRVLDLSIEELFGITEIKPDQTSLKVDWFLRSKEIPQESKSTVRSAIKALEKISKDPHLNLLNRVQ